MNKLSFDIRTLLNRFVNSRYSNMPPLINEGSLLISNYIESGKPFMLARFGAVEIKAMLYGWLPFPFYLLLKKYTQIHLHQNAGFFPVNRTSVKKFTKLMIEDTKLLDILVSWRPEEYFFRKQLRQCKRIKFAHIYPPFSDNTWHKILSDKNVLVIHPFAETIRKQYTEKGGRIYPHIGFPNFKSLTIIQAVQSIAGNTGGYENWFDALEAMKAEIDKAKFDIALIGCGAYGFPLAAHVKRKGKQAIHIGGSLQLYFGIKGKRWSHASIFNENWVSPSSSEIPSNSEKVEGSCYWG